MPKPWSPEPVSHHGHPSGTSSGLRRSSRLGAKSGTSKNPSKSPRKKHKPSCPQKGDYQPPSRLTRTQCTGMLHLRVKRADLYRLPAPMANQPNPNPLPPLAGTTGHLNVIISSPTDLRPFAGDTIDWLVQVARLIFEPLGMGSLSTFTTNTLRWWLNRDSDPTWRAVVQGEPLMATIYEFRPNNTPIMLSKMSLRQETSVTTNTSRPQATAFCQALLGRDRACVISQTSYPRMVTGSHLAPKRLGDAGVRSVIQRFTGLPSTVNRYHHTLGVLLLKTLDSAADNYELGFWHLGPGHQYVIHNFYEAPLTIGGMEPLNPNDQMLHDHPITLTTHNNLCLPPVGLFKWHYLQCVLKRFATNEYKQIENVIHFTVPFCTEDDNDETDFDFDDERNIANPPYPSYPIELAEVRVRQHLEDAERDHAIVEWKSGVSAAA